VRRISKAGGQDLIDSWHPAIEEGQAKAQLRLPMVREPPQNKTKPYIKEKIIETTPSNPFLLFILTKLTKWCRRPQTKPNQTYISNQFYVT
jgi:hypothetical protein